MSTLYQIIAACLAGGLLSLLAAALLTFGLPRSWFGRMVGFSAGILIATALLKLLPEALQGDLDEHSVFGWVLAGLVGFFLLEKFALWHHGHERVGEGFTKAAPMVIVGDAIHNLSDGVLIATAFLADPALGWFAASAIIVHEIPQEVGDFALLLAAGWSRGRALFWNALASMTSVVGGVAGYYWLGAAREWTPAVLAIAAASFIYIALSDLMPWLRQQRDNVAWHGATLASGVGIALLGIGHAHH